MSQGDEVEQHETESFERTEACECYLPEFHRVMHSHSQGATARQTLRWLQGTKQGIEEKIVRFRSGRVRIGLG